MASTARAPRLCRFLAYSGPGLPSPARISKRTSPYGRGYRALFGFLFGGLGFAFGFALAGGRFLFFLSHRRRRGDRGHGGLAEAGAEFGAWRQAQLGGAH